MSTKAIGFAASKKSSDRVSVRRDKPVVVISLDFELRWGMHDKLGLDFDRYRKNLEGSLEVVPALLRALSERNICATWACVGATGCQDWNEYFRRAPRSPQYENPALRVDPRYADLDPHGRLHFAPDLIQMIHGTPGQELGTHTFSHLYLREPGITAKDAEADLAAASLLCIERFDAPPKSLVFPRNQYAFLDIIRASSIRIWRGNPSPWYYNCNEVRTSHLLPRALRLLDSLNPLVHLSSPLDGDMTRASIFLRTDLPGPTWALHKARIERELDSLCPLEIFHLWWHPHSLGVQTAKRLTRVCQILDFVAEKRERGLLDSQNMGELIDQ
jgi:peptidoglycan/xylan/chitin deacetylase (PgdA/CDA1 family)